MHAYPVNRTLLDLSFFELSLIKPFAVAGQLQVLPATNDVEQRGCVAAIRADTSACMRLPRAPEEVEMVIVHHGDGERVRKLFAARPASLRAALRELRVGRPPADWLRGLRPATWATRQRTTGTECPIKPRSRGAGFWRMACQIRHLPTWKSTRRSWASTRTGQRRRLAWRRMCALWTCKMPRGPPGQRTGSRPPWATRPHRLGTLTTSRLRPRGTGRLDHQDLEALGFWVHETTSPEDEVAMTKALEALVGKEEAANYVRSGRGLAHTQVQRGRQDAIDPWKT